jgi:dethiobiotin synthetase
MTRILVTGIGTDVGKTLVSAILVEILGAGYWKPVQAGTEGETDTERVKHLLPETVCYPEASRLKAPCSPHQAAFLEDIEIGPIPIPDFSGDLVIESSGGILVPYRLDRLTIDLFSDWDCQWVVVSRHYLGSINHTLLTVEALRNRRLPILGIVFNGTPNLFSEEAIQCHSGLPVIGRIYPEEVWTTSLIKRYARQWMEETWPSGIETASGILSRK